MKMKLLRVNRNFVQSQVDPIAESPGIDRTRLMSMRSVMLNDDRVPRFG
jgi:hypothetical protein